MAEYYGYYDDDDFDHGARRWRNASTIMRNTSHAQLLLASARAWKDTHKPDPQSFDAVLRCLRITLHNYSDATNTGIESIPRLLRTRYPNAPLIIPPMPRMG